MGGVPVKRQTHGKSRRRRSHLALTNTRLAPCPKCKMPVLPHRACANCGFYTKKDRARKNVSAQEAPAPAPTTEASPAPVSEAPVPGSPEPDAAAEPTSEKPVSEDKAPDKDKESPGP